MIEELSKMIAYGYLGLKMDKHMSEKAAARTKAIEELRRQVVIVYDGKAPYAAAQNLAKYMREKGYKATVCDREQFRPLENEPGLAYVRVIIIGHHDFTKEQMETVDLKFDQYGLKIGVKGQRYVLRACRSDLAYGKKGRKEFATYYDREVSCYKEWAEKYGVPLTFGSRGETRESQYDLLCLKCILSLELERELDQLFGDAKVSGRAAQNSNGV